MAARPADSLTIGFVFPNDPQIKPNIDEKNGFFGYFYAFLDTELHFM
jgi:hypothetical protein